MLLHAKKMGRKKPKALKLEMPQRHQIRWQCLVVVSPPKGRDLQHPSFWSKQKVHWGPAGALLITLPLVLCKWVVDANRCLPSKSSCTDTGKRNHVAHLLCHFISFTQTLCSLHLLQHFINFTHFVHFTYYNISSTLLRHFVHFIYYNISSTLLRHFVHFTYYISSTLLTLFTSPTTTCHQLYSDTLFTPPTTTFHQFYQDILLTSLTFCQPNWAYCQLSWHFVNLTGHFVSFTDILSTSMTVLLYSVN